MQSLFILVLTSLISFPSQPPDPAVATFHDDALHFTITYPATLKAAGLEAEVMDKAKAETNNPAEKKAMSCITTPLVAIRETDGFAMLMIIRMNLECLGAPAAASILQPLAQSSLQQGLLRLGLATVGIPATYKLDDHDAVFLRGTVKDAAGKEIAYGAASCALVEKTAVCWEAVSTDKAAASSLIGSPFSFDSHPSQPLVPADVIAK